MVDVVIKRSVAVLAFLLPFLASGFILLFALGVLGKADFRVRSESEFMSETYPSVTLSDLASDLGNW